LALWPTLPRTYVLFIRNVPCRCGQCPQYERQRTGQAQSLHRMSVGGCGNVFTQRTDEHRSLTTNAEESRAGLTGVGSQNEHSSCRPPSAPLEQPRVDAVEARQNSAISVFIVIVRSCNAVQCPLPCQDAGYEPTGPDFNLCIIK